MQPINPKRKPLFKIVVTPKSILMELRHTKRSIGAMIALTLLLIVVLIVAVTDREIRSKALELVISIIEAIITFFSASPKTK